MKNCTATKSEMLEIWLRSVIVSLILRLSVHRFGFLVSEKSQQQLSRIFFFVEEEEELRRCFEGCVAVFLRKEG